MKVVFETEVEGIKYRHIHYHEGAEATVENLTVLLEELSELLNKYNEGDHTRCPLQVELQREFDSNKTLAILSYRVSKTVK